MKTVDPDLPMPIGKVLKRLLEDMGLAFEPVGTRLKRAWEEAVGPTLALHSVPHCFKRGTLTVLCSSPHWMLELRMLKEQILERLNAQLGTNKIKRLTFKLDQIGPERDQDPKVKRLHAEIPEEEAQRFTASIKDEELKKRILRILEAIRGLRQGT